MKNKYSALFRDDMSSNEARLVFFKEVDGKTEEELALLKEAYHEVAQRALHREIEVGINGWLC